MKHMIYFYNRSGELVDSKITTYQYSTKNKIRYEGGEFVVYSVIVDEDERCVYVEARPSAKRF